jgi:hypothetical protein
MSCYGVLATKVEEELALWLTADVNIQGVFVKLQVQHVGLTADLAILNVGLDGSSTEIDKGQVGFAAVGAGILSGVLHRRSKK